jgi:hypothetical protein
MRLQGRVYAWCGCRDQVIGRRLGSWCPRRGHRGHGSWYLSLEILTGFDGRRGRVRREGYPSRDAARRALRQLAMPLVDEDATLVTVGQWLDRRSGQRESTCRGYAGRVRLYLALYLAPYLAACCSPN